MGKEVLGKVLKTAIQGAFSHNQQRKAEKAQAKQAVASVRANVMVNKQSNNDPIYPVYGKQRVGGTRVFVEASNGSGSVQTIDPQGEATNTEYLNMVVAMCEGEIDNMTQLWFNDTIVWDSGVNGTLSSLASGGYELQNFMSGTKYSGANMYIAWYPGTDSQLTDSTIQTSVGNLVWKTTNRLQGISYLALKLQADEKFGGQLPVFNATLQGKKILDVSTLTEGDTLADITSFNYTAGADQNPADVLYDLLISDRYGKGLDRDANGNLVVGTNINLLSFQSAKTHSNAARSGSGYPLNGFLQTEKQIFTNVSEILEACNGILRFVDGKYQFDIKRKNESTPGSAAFVFNKENILSEISLVLPAKSAKLNKVTGNFSNAAEKYNDDLVLFKSDAYILEDNGTVLETQEDYTLITDANLVTDLIEQMVEKSRNRYTISFTAAHTALLLHAGQVVKVRHDDFGWDALNMKDFRIQELKLTEDNTVEIIATTYNSALEL